MKSEKRILKDRETSEKKIDRYLCERVRENGGMALKYSSGTQTGFPDRVCMLPGGVTVWVEVKGDRGELTKLQALRIMTMRRMGHSVRVCDSRESVDALMVDLGELMKHGRVVKKRRRENSGERRVESGESREPGSGMAEPGSRERGSGERGCGDGV